MVLYVRSLLQFLLYLYLLTFVCVFETTARWLARCPLSLRSMLDLHAVPWYPFGSITPLYVYLYYAPPYVHGVLPTRYRSQCARSVK